MYMCLYMCMNIRFFHLSLYVCVNVRECVCMLDDDNARAFYYFCASLQHLFDTHYSLLAQRRVP